ncbi:hypothetical protein [Candidatus Synchoanobacter obligatus]|uniref:Type IV pilus biogenesis protein PilP n=1 Tax=Candidatus Synchoanobacter obligatus TaxID=2919597 RepID=A0ABT1L5D3_9GAMM|nr:hypothetical protein [Candidatus Synchoanobacter obligatus]MCP8352376.1 hypothetical protein [Candidatus Synchoanobacter obligatus]
MADERDNQVSDQDQEYSFPEKTSQDFGSVPHSGGTESLMSLLKNTRIMAAVGGCIVLYILLSVVFGGDDEDVADEAFDSTPVETMTMDEPVIDLQPVVDETPMSIFAEIDDSNTKEEEKNKEIEEIRSRVASLTRQNQKLNVKLKALDEKLDGIVAVVEASAKELSEISAKRAEAAEEKEQKVVEQNYRIRAVISGRAWVEDGSGNNMTVKVGDNIPTYGRVTKIKPVEGIVETASGRVISFSFTSE